MAVPLFLIEFIKEHHRSPKTSELTLKQRKKIRIAIRVSEAYNRAIEGEHVHPVIIKWLKELAALEGVKDT